MTEYTPTTTAIRNKYALWRKSVDGNPWDDSMAEFDRWLDAHDQSIWDAVRTVSRDPADLASAAWVIAHEVRRGQVIPAGTPVIMRQPRGKVTTYFHGADHELIGAADIRTLTPLPPVIPDDCNAVWAGSEWLPDDVRALWVRGSDVGWKHTVTPSEARDWCDGTLAFDVLTAVSDELINPVPIPEEGDR